MPSVQPYTRAQMGSVASHVLVTNVDEVFEEARRLIGAESVVEGRAGFALATGSYRGVEVSVARAPIGGHSLLVLVDELSKLGAKVFIKVGVGCATNPNVQVGDIVVASSAVKGDGISRSLCPPEVPAVASFNLLEIVLEVFKSHAADHFGVKDAKPPSWHVGTVWTTDLYYVNGLAREEQGERRSLVGKYAVAADPDTASLYTLALVKKLQAASIIVVEGSLVRGIARGSILALTEVEGGEMRRRLEVGFEAATRMALESLALHREHAARVEARAAARR